MSILKWYRKMMTTMVRIISVRVNTVLSDPARTPESVVSPSALDPTNLLSETKSKICICFHNQHFWKGRSMLKCKIKFFSRPTDIFIALLSVEWRFTPIWTSPVKSVTRCVVSTVPTTRLYAIFPIPSVCTFFMKD